MLHHPSCPIRTTTFVPYCGNYPELDHTDCPSSVECTAVTVGYLAERFCICDLPVYGPADEDGSYVFVCIRSLRCDPLDATHAAECDRANDAARHEFYVHKVAESFAQVIL